MDNSSLVDAATGEKFFGAFPGEGVESDITDVSAWSIRTSASGNPPSVISVVPAHMASGVLVSTRQLTVRVSERVRAASSVAASDVAVRVHRVTYDTSGT